MLLKWTLSEKIEKFLTTLTFAWKEICMKEEKRRKKRTSKAYLGNEMNWILLISFSCFSCWWWLHGNCPTFVRLFSPFFFVYFSSFLVTLQRLLLLLAVLYKFFVVLLLLLISVSLSTNGKYTKLSSTKKKFGHGLVLENQTTFSLIRFELKRIFCDCCCCWCCFYFVFFSINKSVWYDPVRFCWEGAFVETNLSKQKWNDTKEKKIVTK